MAISMAKLFPRVIVLIEPTKYSGRWSPVRVVLCACDPGACPAKKQKELQNKIFVGGAIAVALIATAMIVMKK